MTASLVQSAISSGSPSSISTTLGATPTIGNLMVASLTLRSGGATWPAGWRDDFVGTTNGSGTGNTHIRSRLVQSGDSSTLTVSGISDGANLAVHEYAGFGTAYSSAGADGAMGNYAMTVPTVTAPAEAAWVLLFLSISGWPDVGGASTTTPYTARQNSYSGGAPYWRYGESADRVRANDLGSYGGETVYGTDGNNFKATLVVYAPLPEPNPCNPRIIDDFNRAVDIIGRYDSYNRSNWGPIWVSDNIIPPRDGVDTLLDDFNRTASSWGTSILGYPWTQVGFTNATASTDGSYGIIAATASAFSADLRVTGPGPWADANFTEKTRLLVPSATPAAGWSFYRTVSGASNTLVCSLYWTGTGNLKLEVGDSSGTTSYTSSIAMINDDPIFVKWRLSAGQVQAKIWRDNGSSEPAWQVSHSASTAIGANPYYDINWSSGSTASTVRVDYIRFGGDSSIYSIDGSNIYIDINLSAAETSSHNERLTLPFELWMLSNEDYSIRFKVGDIPDGVSGNNATEIYFEVEGPTYGSIINTNFISSLATWGRIGLGPTSVVKTDWIANTWYTTKITRTDTNASIRVWADSEPEPPTAQVVLTHNYTWPADVNAVFTLWVIWDNSITNPSLRHKFWIDNLYAGCMETATLPPTPSAGFGVYTRDRMLLSIRASFTDDNLYNHALVIGTGNKSQVYKSEIKDENSLSPTRIAAIGDRVFKYESDQISTQAAADKAALKVYLSNCLISEDVDLEAICNPALEGNDVIAVQELTFSELDQKFRLRAFTVPLSTSRQTLKLNRVIAV